MLQFPYIQQECPICGRPVRIRAEYAGKRVSCEHCLGKFVAENPLAAESHGDGEKDSAGRFSSNRTERLLRRADELLQICGNLYSSECCPEYPDCPSITY